MKKSLFIELAIVGIYISLWLFLMSSKAVFAASSEVRLSRVDGMVEVRKAGNENGVPATEGMILERGDSLISRDKSAAVLSWSNGSIVKVYPNTTLSLLGVVMEVDKKMEKTFLGLERGRIFAKGQVPEHLLCDFGVKMGGITVRTQGAEFALTYNPDNKSMSVFSILGRVVTQVSGEWIRVEEGYQQALKLPTDLGNAKPVKTSDKTKASLEKVSYELGGSLLREEWVSEPGGPLKARIGGVRNRRGNAPYKVQFNALVKGGSGKIKSYKWDLGDGTVVNDVNPEHTFTQGVYIVVLTVEDENGQKQTAQLSISAEEECAC